MPKTQLVVVAFLLLAIGTGAQQQRFDGKTLWRRVEILAADDMEGRAPGSAGLQRAETYVIDQLRKSGVAPAGIHGYLQPVKLVRRRVVERDSSAALLRNGEVEPLVVGDDIFFPNDVDVAGTVEAPLVFLGYGLRIPAKDIDDFAGLDLKGKIAVTVPGAPAGIEPALAAEFSTPSRRWRQFRDAGLIGWIDIAYPEASWPLLRDAITTTTVYLADDEFNDAKGERIHLVFNPAQADKLFAGSGHTAKEVFALEKAAKPLPRFPLHVALRTTAALSKQAVDSANVIAKLEGRDARLRNEYVVLSAHIDHLGVREPVNGDGIYNGAIDNASGVAALLDIADAMTRDGARPKRSVLFAFFTAEEAGKYGSKYFTAHPTVGRRSIVADVNLDGIQAIVPLQAVQVLGAEESDLGDVVQRVAESYGVGIESELDNQSSRFANSSDQGSFAFAGIPAVKLNVGFPGQLNAVQRTWRRERYHTPFDDAQQPMNFETIAKFEEIARASLLEVANSPRRPAWKSTSVYKRYAQ